MYERGFQCQPNLYERVARVAGVVGVVGCTITYGWLQGAKEPGHQDHTRAPAPGTRAAPGHQDTHTKTPAPGTKTPTPHQCTRQRCHDHTRMGHSSRAVYVGLCLPSAPICKLPEQ